MLSPFFSNSIAAIIPCKQVSERQLMSLPLMVCTVSAGFPSPAEGSIDKPLDLNELLIRHPSATFFVRVKGDSMKNAGILDGDLIVVERGEIPKNRDIVLAIVDGEFTIKRWVATSNGIVLQAENPEYPDISLGPVSKESSIEQYVDWEVWGVVRYAIHSCVERRQIEQ